ncbi:MAG: prolipoprotein diacylglyceryl transferase [Flavobacteriales bacterium]
MYPALYYFFYDVFGWEIDGLKYLPSFGFFVAMSFLAAAYFFGKELKRKEQQGLLSPTTEKFLKGKPASAMELATNGLIGFILGFKFIGLFLGSAGELEIKDYLFSAEGNLLAGIALGALFVYLKYTEKEKEKLVEPKWVNELVHPYQRVSEITMIAAVAGIIGAKIFHQLENWNEFMRDPIGNLFSDSGLTFYGGLILGTAAVVYYVRKKGMNVLVVADAIAPALILAYAIGRIGCQVSGDGDWGIANLEPKPEWLGFLPDWMWAYDFPHNVNKQGILMADCGGWEPYCAVLPVKVFPTAFYETLMGLIIFGFLWAIRKKISIPGTMFCIYLFFNGVERFLIELIRVNNEGTFLGMQITQAQFISSLLMIIGAIGTVYLYKKGKKISA